MKKPEFIIASKQTWQLITSDTLWKILSLLDATRTLVDASINKTGGDVNSEDIPDVAAGLYTYAVEEFGKYLYLTSIEPNDEKYHINYSDEFINHPKKFERALSNLPAECKLLHKGEVTDSDFYDPLSSADIIADFETRKKIFYSDLDPYFVKKIPQQTPPVSAKLLKIGVQKLWEIADSELTKRIKEKNMWKR